MPLNSGSTLGPYTLAERIGAGGMGEVYRATDTKLGREVAIKTLPAALADDRDRLSRFEREAKLLAALNHPHIASVYSLDEHDGTVFIAMELVDGETLQSKIERGPIELVEALHLSLQIAEALEAAHEKGVVHRDLKPANIMINGNGQVKVLDFGLAKAFTGNPDEASPVHSPASIAMTQAGLVLGTAGYMSPEQASGQATDQRADVWAFGVVLFEMLTGQPVFSGESVPHVLADVLKGEPEWDELPEGTNPRLKLLLEHCLTKRPRNRLHSIADARIELEAVLDDPTGAKDAPPVAAPVRGSRLQLATVALSAAAIAAAAAWLLRPVPEPAPAPVMRFSIPLPDDQDFPTAPVSIVAVSPDGSRIAYVANQQIYQRNLQETEARPVVGTENSASAIGALAPTYSPDGQWLAFIDVGSNAGPYVVKRVPASGGAPVTIHTADGATNFEHGLTWPSQDWIMFANFEGVVRIPANGGQVEVLVAREEGERLYSPQLLPGGEAVLFTRVPGAPASLGGYEGAQVVVQSIGGDDRTVVWQGGSTARYVPTGHLIYAQGAALFAIAFDLISREVSGGPVPLMDRMRRSSNGFSDAANFAISETGTLVNIPGIVGVVGVEQIQTTVVWVDREGREEPLPIRPDDYTHARVSPDGTKIALVVGASLGRQTPPTIWIYDSETRNLRLLTTDPEVHDGPVWSADGRRLFFRTPGENALDINVIDLESGEVSVVAEGSGEGFPFPLPWALSPDEQTLAIINAQSQTDVDVATVDLRTGQLTRMLFGPGVQNEPSISPNGAWLAHIEGETVGGDTEINIRPFPNVFRTLIPVGPGASPIFSRDGTELFFEGRDGGISAVPIEYEPNLRVGAASTLVQSSEYLWQLFGRTWDPDPSGERFIVPRNPANAGVDDDAEDDTRRINVVLNWFEELRNRVPTQ